ncbi:Lcl domain-containing protein [Methylophilus aquaticus]|uniref:DUF1566 domain-containing protein n=1 Tax=Methylophilus aquaticus TaxID=1971610 RepID=A0ABT9JWP2_9PROT|nr:DUF1566 domain-containing protein [Methylophilus aquaticus]MDP8568973.1 DUF1566 domain-containing protein [Methylophilus aquaticus]
MQLNAQSRTLIGSVMLLAATQAHATLTSYTSNGVDVVYSSVSDVTWTKDANLLGSMIASQGFSTVVNNILAVSPAISNTPNYFSPTGTYTLTISDFSSNGRVSWFGAMAFINYLNSNNYAGSNQWRLPTVVNTAFGYNTATNGTAAGDELVELFSSELGGKEWSNIPDTATFDNEQASVYWSGAEYARDSRYAYNFDTSIGHQYDDDKSYLFYAWAVSPGQISAVPAPPAAWLFGSGLLGVAGFARRKIKPCN